MEEETVGRSSEKKTKKKKEKKTIGEWIIYIIVTVVVFVVTWCTCDIFINGNTWYLVDIDLNQIYSVSITYVDGETLYDNTFYLEDPAYKEIATDMIYFINNRTPHNQLAQCLLRNKNNLRKLKKYFDTSSTSYSNEFRVVITTKDEQEKVVAFSDENKEAFIAYILDEENSTPEGVYQFND